MYASCCNRCIQGSSPAVKETVQNDLFLPCRSGKSGVEIPGRRDIRIPGTSIPAEGYYMFCQRFHFFVPCHVLPLAGVVQELNPLEIFLYGHPLIRRVRSSRPRMHQGQGPGNRRGILYRDLNPSCRMPAGMGMQDMRTAAHSPEARRQVSL